MSELRLLSGEKTQAKLPEMSTEQSKMINTVRLEWQNWRDWFESYHRDRIRDNYKRIHAKQEAYDDVNDQWRGVNGAPIKMALEYAVVETYKTRLAKAFLGNRDFVKVLPRKKTTAENAKLMNDICYYYFDEDNIIFKMTEIIDQVCLNGSVPWLVYQHQKKQKTMQPVTGQEPIYSSGVITGYKPTEYMQEVEELIENRPTLEIYDIESVAFNWTVGYYENSPYYCFRILAHRHDLSEMFPEYKDIFNSGMLDWDGKDDFTSQRTTSVGLNNDGSGDTGRQGRIEVFYWMEKEATFVVFSDKLIIEIENQDIDKKVHTGMINMMPKFKEPYGRDLVQLEAQFADLWNEMINIDVDSTKISSALTYKAKKNAGIEWDTIYTAPGNIQLMDDLTSIEPVQYSYVSGQAIKMLEYISDKDQVVTGATRAVTGTPVKAEFMGDIQRMQIEANLKFWYALVFIRLGMKEIVKAFVKHIQQYIAPEISPQNPLVFMTTGEKGFDQREINNPADLLGDFDYIISFEVDDVDKNLVRAQLIQAIDIATKNPMLASAIADPQALLSLLFKQFPAFKELENVTGGFEQQLSQMLQKLDTRQLQQVLLAVGEMIDAQTRGEVQNPNDVKQIEAPKGRGGTARVPVDGQALSVANNNAGITSNIAGGNANDTGATM